MIARYRFAGGAGTCGGCLYHSRVNAEYILYNTVENAPAAHRTPRTVVP